MDIRFDEVAAKTLIKQMDSYCSGIKRETQSLLKITSNSTEWNDNQSKAFENNIKEMAKVLNEVLALESEYIRNFYQRVIELEG